MIFNDNNYINPINQINLNFNHFNTFNNNMNYFNFNNGQQKRKIIDEYTLEMLGRVGWICEQCNNLIMKQEINAIDAILKKCQKELLKSQVLKEPEKIHKNMIGFAIIVKILIIHFEIFVIGVN